MEFGIGSFTAGLEIFQPGKIQEDIPDPSAGIIDLIMTNNSVRRQNM